MITILGAGGPIGNELAKILAGKEFIEMAAKEFGVAPKYRVLSRPMLRVAGWFKPEIGESYEMLYQSDSPYLFDSTKFAKEFGFGGFLMRRESESSRTRINGRREAF
jgi:hypothetical protein